MKNLGFRYNETEYIVRCSSKEGVWGQPWCTSDKYISLHVCSTSLHYGQSVFEGLKVFRGVDGKVRVFRWQDYALRMQSSATATYMSEVPLSLFKQCLDLIITKNISFLPSYESGNTLYIRPLLIGTTPQLGVGPGTDFELILIASPIGTYYSSEHYQSFVIVNDIDRVAPKGLGAYKVAGNYANAFRASVPAHQRGLDCIFLDAKMHKYIEECTAANFIAIRKNEYYTPKDLSILPSVTNSSLMTIASDKGMIVKQQKIRVDELASFDEVAACGTACVLIPMDKIIYPSKNITFTYKRDSYSVLQDLAQTMLDIQYGRAEDKYRWCTIID